MSKRDLRKEEKGRKDRKGDCICIGRNHLNIKVCIITFLSAKTQIHTQWIFYLRNGDLFAQWTFANLLKSR